MVDLYCPQGPAKKTSPNKYKLRTVLCLGGGGVVGGRGQLVCWGWGGGGHNFKNGTQGWVHGSKLFLKGRGEST